ncbi:uncharacterized protein EV422DRAFT_498711 [Fimicolochytrium jonesii]|uniref:uncharacterized protein n=1 Tax=Fimicolochytrium jonesii TaxID=1396493 RepID=UPI0022FF3BFC|nr:uncharacterized protein EV422DRAFT_498711 [Fimicolochytrium jonesii]KAI8818592.1 hypothetical protein EV422DRAFT_498711 [Fimicolochytrium jonesii]
MIGPDGRFPPASNTTKTTTSTTAAIGRRPQGVEKWIEFERDARNHQIASSAPLHRSRFFSVPLHEGRSGASEALVESILDAEQFRVTNRICKGTAIEVGHRAAVLTAPFGQPDRIIHNCQAMLVPIEVKPRSVLPDDVDLVAQSKAVFKELKALSDHRYMMLTDDEKAQWNSIVHANVAVKAVIQVNGYACANRRRYSLITTQSSYWFIERPEDRPDVLRIAGPIRTFHDSPTVAQALDYFIGLAMENPTTPSPSESTTSPSGCRATKLLDQPSAIFTSRDVIEFKEVDLLPALRSFATDNSTVVQTVAFDSTNYATSMALKTVDRLTCPEIVEQLENEIDVYHFLENMQGRTIPRLVACGFFQGGEIAIIGTEFVEGRHISAADRSLFDCVRAAYMSLHQAGVIHGDIASRNIIITGLSARPVVLIDFGMAHEATPAKIQSELAQVENMLANLH